MSLKKDVLIGIILILISFLTRSFYEEYRIFFMYVPLYVGILYLNLNGYYNEYSIVRFFGYKQWVKKILSIIVEHSTIASMVLCLDKIFIVKVEEVQIGALFLEYFLFLLVVSAVLICPRLSNMRAVISSIILLVMIKARFFNLSILYSLYDGRKFTIENGILKSIIFLAIINVIIYGIYFMWIKRSVRGYGYDAIKKSNNSYFNCNNDIIS